MELLFRKYFWTINLAFLAMAAFLVARTANVFTESALLTTPELSTPGSAAPRPGLLGPTRLSDKTLSRVTGIALPELVKEPVALAGQGQPGAPDDPNATPIHTSLHVRLLGTTVANSPKWSWAVIEDTQAHSNDTYMVDDVLQGATVLLIVDDCSELVPDLEPKSCVLIRNNGHREYIDDKEGNGPMTAMAPSPVAAPVSRAPPKEVLGSGIRSTGENQYTVPRAEVDKALANMNELAMSARIVPAFKDGVATGFKLFSIRPDSLYAKIGVQNGDVIRRINGFEINSPDKALEAYAKLREASRIEIEVERNGAVVRKTYDVQ